MTAQVRPVLKSRRNACSSRSGKRITPNDRHEGRDKAILAQRELVYRAAKKRTPRRWTGDTRDWSPAGDVTLNPERRTTLAA